MAGNVTGAFGSIAAAIDTLISKIVELIEKFADIVVPDILTPGSPTPFETGLRGIISAMQKLNPELSRMEGIFGSRTLGAGTVLNGMPVGNGSPIQSIRNRSIDDQTTM